MVSLSERNSVIPFLYKRLSKRCEIISTMKRNSNLILYLPSLQTFSCFNEAVIYIYIYIFFYHSLSVVNSLPYLHALFLLLSTCIMYIRECKSTCLGMSLCDNLWYANVWLWRYTFTRVRVRGVRAPLCTTQHKGDKGRIYSQGRKTNIKTKHELCIIWLFFPLF